MARSAASSAGAECSDHHTAGHRDWCGDFRVTGNPAAMAVQRQLLALLPLCAIIELPRMFLGGGQNDLAVQDNH
ncbi:MAG: hypothetical protein ACUVSJ_12730 [Anaerolineae bacterium]